MSSNHKLILALLGILLIVYAAIVLAGGMQTEGIIRIGFLGPLTGKSSEWGKGTRDGLMHAVRACNDSGGIAANSIRVSIKDSSKYVNLDQAVDEFIQDGIDIVVGPATSSDALRVMPSANRKKVLFLSPSASTNELLHKDDYFLRTVQNDRDIASSLALYLFKIRGWKNIRSAWSRINSSNNEGWHSSFQETIESCGGKVSCAGSFDHPGDYAHIVSGLTSAECDGIFLCASLKEIAEIVQRIKKTDPKAGIAINSAAALKNAPDYLGKPGEHILTAKPYFKKMSDPLYAAFHTSFTRDYSYEPEYIAVLGYDAGTVLIEALGRCGRYRADDLKRMILQKGSFDSVIGKIHLDRYGDARREIFILEIINGEYVKVQ